MKIIGLLSDFGLRDSYISEMKGVVLSRCPEVKLIDISHEIPKEAVGCFLGSHGFLEIAMRVRNISKSIHVRPGSKLTIST